MAKKNFKFVSSAKRIKDSKNPYKVLYCWNSDKSNKIYKSIVPDAKNSLDAKYIFKESIPENRQGDLSILQTKRLN